METVVTIETLSPKDTVERLRAVGIRISEATLRAGIQQGVFPFGSCVMSGDRPRWCYVYKVQLEQWIADRAVPAAE
ncbi:MAG: hypothetical protein LUH09_06615 [Clostridiales bacterium]|nr:hypothetical protein [Clostridiales bacterium]